MVDFRHEEETYDVAILGGSEAPAELRDRTPQEQLAIAMA